MLMKWAVPLLLASYLNSHADEMNESLQLHVHGTFLDTQNIVFILTMAI